MQGHFTIYRPVEKVADLKIAINGECFDFEYQWRGQTYKRTVSQEEMARFMANGEPSPLEKAIKMAERDRHRNDGPIYSQPLGTIKGTFTNPLPSFNGPIPSVYS